MHFDGPLVQGFALVFVAWFFRLWLQDYRRAKASHPNPQALPGAKPVVASVVWIAVLGALVILAAEVFGEDALGISKEQSNVTVLFGAYTLAAAFAEELVFRGFLVIESRGRRVLWMSIFGFSILFALAHPYLWTWEGMAHGGLALQLDPKALFSTGVIFVASLWFYWVRFNVMNPTRSLLPCIAAHFAMNLGVFVVKLAQGHVSGWF